ncbi:ABC transporter substrate-binding protein [Aquipuribacter nitratireducens]|uniref:ABC transporter substrate-binding protein n=1 Tax=Aquipuribacter nitratireducens TaxID=650104 RepID=A0ABW0GQ06_9MICO
MRLQTRSRALVRLAAATATALALAACSTGGGVEGEGLEEAPDADTDATDEAGGGATGDAPTGTLVAAITGTPDQFDPHSTSAYASFQVLENVYDTLVVPNAEDLTFEPSLAESWETSEDGLTWTFTLREGVTFHDGSEFDSADVAYSYNRIIDEQLANSFRFANVESIDTPDPQTVVLNLSAPTPNLLANIGGFKGMAILPEGAAEDLDLANEANGTGPFTLESTSAGGAEVAAFDGYWGEGPFVEGVEFRYVPESAAALTALRNGDIDWTDNVPPQDIATLEGEEGVELGQVGSTDYYYVAFDTTEPPFDDVDVRRAIATAVDREAIAEAATFGAGTANQTAIPEGSFFASDYAPFPADAAAAEQLLADAGVEDLSFEIMVPSTAPQAVTAAEVLSSQLAEIGVTATPDTVEEGAFLSRQGEGDFDAFSWSWIGNLDPFGYYHAQHLTDGGFNFQGYSNEQVDELLQQASTETDQDARKELYDQAVEIIVDEVSYLYYYNPDVVQAWSGDLSGYTVRPDRAINFDTVQLGG